MSTTMSTIGYGEINPDNKSEMLFVMMCEVLGFIVTGRIMNTAISLLSNVKLYKVRRDNEIMIEDWLQQVDKFLGDSRRIQGHYYDKIVNIILTNITDSPDYGF